MFVIWRTVLAVNAVVCQIMLLLNNVNRGRVSGINNLTIRVGTS